jgi:predicted Zn-dependent protease
VDSRSVAEHLPPESPRVATYRAVVRWRTGDVAGAIQDLRAVAARARLSADPPIPSPLYLLGEALADAGRDAEAVDVLRRFEAEPVTTPGWLHPRARYHLARCLERLGDRAAARAAVEELLRTWANATPDQPLLAEARALGKRLGAR